MSIINQDLPAINNPEASVTDLEEQVRLQSQPKFRRESLAMLETIETLDPQQQIKVLTAIVSKLIIIATPYGDSDDKEIPGVGKNWL